MEINIKAEPQEIAALVVALQERQKVRTNNVVQQIDQVISEELKTLIAQISPEELSEQLRKNQSALSC